MEKLLFLLEGFGVNQLVLNLFSEDWLRFYGPTLERFAKEHPDSGEIIISEPRLFKIGKTVRDFLFCSSQQSSY